MYWILDKNKNAVEVDVVTWAKFFDKIENRIVEKTELNSCEVSTVFLGLDHGFGYAKKLLFETMAFGGPNDQEMFRYETWDEAVAGHAKAVRLNKDL